MVSPIPYEATLILAPLPNWISSLHTKSGYRTNSHFNQTMYCILYYQVFDNMDIVLLFCCILIVVGSQLNNEISTTTHIWSGG